MLQRQPIQKLHGDKSLSVLVIDFIDGADIGVVEGGRSLRFALEAGQSLRILRNLVRQELQGYKAVQLYVLSFVHHTHAAAAELLDDPIVRDGLADHGIRAMLGGMRGPSQWKPRHCRYPKGLPSQWRCYISDTD